MGVCDGLSCILARYRVLVRLNFPFPFKRATPRNFVPRVLFYSFPGPWERGLPASQTTRSKVFYWRNQSNIISNGELRELNQTVAHTKEINSKKVDLRFAVARIIFSNFTRFSCLYCLFYLYHNCLCILLHFLRGCFKYLGNYQYVQVVWDERSNLKIWK